MPVPNTYSYVTLAQAIAALQARLYLGSDANQQFWTPAELQAYIVEAKPPRHRFGIPVPIAG